MAFYKIYLNSNYTNEYKRIQTNTKEYKQIQTIIKKIDFFYLNQYINFIYNIENNNLVINNHLKCFLIYY
jgi:hypothetical protein